MNKMAILDTGIYLHAAHEYLDDSSDCRALISKIKNQSVMSPRKVQTEISTQIRDLSKLIDAVKSSADYIVDGPNVQIERFINSNIKNRLQNAGQFAQNIVIKFKNAASYCPVESFATYLTKVQFQLLGFEQLLNTKAFDNCLDFLDDIRDTTKEMKHNSPDSEILSATFQYALKAPDEIIIFTTRDSNHILSNRSELIGKYLKKLQKIDRGRNVNLEIFHPRDTLNAI